MIVATAMVAFEHEQVVNFQKQKRRLEKIGSQTETKKRAAMASWQQWTEEPVTSLHDDRSPNRSGRDRFSVDESSNGRPTTTAQQSKKSAN
ncbi:hypothetical protein [Convivina praedatoris]|uniref:hypothetical protein n=1 Tax=Convivina praedatoris TaxID=2880963 RepID=UPI002010916F|nr:hypothetical protein [Convivina sp. LMG 32447]